MEECNNSNIKQNIEIRFSVLFFVFKIGGIPLLTKEISIFQQMFNVLITFCSSSMYVCIIIDVFMHTEDLKRTMQTMRLVFIMIMHMWTEINIRLRKGTLNHLLFMSESFTWEEMPAFDVVSGELTMAGLVPLMNKVFKNFYIYSIVYHFLQSALRVFTSRDMIYQSWYPFDATVSPVYEFVLLTQVLGTLRISALFLGIPYLYSVLVSIPCMQLEKVRALLLSINQKNEMPETSTDAETADGCYLEHNLKECIRLHQDIISYLNVLEKLTSVMLGGIFFLLLLTSCTAAFSTVLGLGDVTDLLQSIYVYAMAMSVTSVYCIFGTILEREYEVVKDAAWSSDWVGIPVSYQRSIALIMTMSNNGFNLTAGKIVPVSKSTLMSMINESMSLFMFLLTMKDKGEELKN